ncbi:MAG TPA: hypothetical protein VH594_25065 [Trebonia sp.]
MPSTAIAATFSVVSCGVRTPETTSTIASTTAAAASWQADSTIAPMP